MNLIDYNQAVEALEKERQLLLNREQYEAEHILVNHAINVINEMPVIRQLDIVRCKECKYSEKWHEVVYACGKPQVAGAIHRPDWFCADGKKP